VLKSLFDFFDSDEIVLGVRTELVLSSDNHSVSTLTNTVDNFITFFNVETSTHDNLIFSVGSKISVFLIVVDNRLWDVCLFFLVIIHFM